MPGQEQGSLESVNRQLSLDARPTRSIPSMHANAIYYIVGVLALVAVLGAGFYFLPPQNQATLTPVNPTQPPAPEPPPSPPVCTATKCGEECVNIGTDARHCGACFSECPGGSGCLDGKCVPICVEGDDAACKASLGSDSGVCCAYWPDRFFCARLNTSEACGSCGNVCGQGGNAGRPFCCPSGGSWNCSSVECVE